jgi:flagellar biosynthesis chaperone FliJ
MSDKESYLEYLQEQLDQWLAEVKELKEKAKVGGSRAMENMPDQIKVLERKVEEGRKKIKEIADANEESWESLKEGFDGAWESLSAGFKDAAAKFKWEKKQ